MTLLSAMYLKVSAQMASCTSRHLQNKAAGVQTGAKTRVHMRQHASTFHTVLLQHNHCITCHCTTTACNQAFHSINTCTALKLLIDFQ